MDKIERDLMSEEEFEEYINNSLNLRTFNGVNRFKSAGRAFRRGNITAYGDIIPNKPYKNKGNTCKRKGHHSRAMNELKKKIYGELRELND